MQTISLRRRLLGLAVLLPLLTLAVAAHAQTVINSLPYTISTSGAYVLGSNLNGTATSGALLTIATSNVVLDMQNHYIAGPVGNTSQTTVGISASGQNNITILNGTVSYCYIGINLGATSSTNNVNHRLDNLRVTHCYYEGIQMFGAVAARVSNSLISDIGGTSNTSSAIGINLTGNGFTVQGCTVTNVTASTAANAIGIYSNAEAFSRGNQIVSCYTGIQSGKIQDNLTYGCTTAFSGTVDAGGNN